MKEIGERRKNEAVLAKEAVYVRREDKKFRRPTRREDKNLQRPTKKENNNLGMGGEKGLCYFKLNELFQNPNTASFPDITMTLCTWFILPHKVANENC